MQKLGPGLYKKDEQLVFYAPEFLEHHGIPATERGNITVIERALAKGPSRKVPRSPSVRSEAPVKFLFVLMYLAGLGLSSLCCAWFPFWLAAPVSIALGVILAKAGDEICSKRHKRKKQESRRLQPQPRFTARTYDHHN